MLKIEKHPILDIPKTEEITFTYEGKTIKTEKRINYSNSLT